jgi:hypothetical protein
MSDSEKTEKTGQRSVATKLVDIARVLYDLGVSDDGTPYATQPEVPHVALPLRGSKTGLRANLARDYFEKNDAVASQQALADALTALRMTQRRIWMTDRPVSALEGFAAQAEPCCLHLRVAQYNGTVYIDLADPGDHRRDARADPRRRPPPAVGLHQRRRARPTDRVGVHGGRPDPAGRAAHHPRFDSRTRISEKHHHQACGVTDRPVRRGAAHAAPRYRHLDYRGQRVKGGGAGQPIPHT